jgi:transposase
MLHLSPQCRYYVYTGSCDMRKGFDSLCGTISSEMKEDVFAGAVFIFLNRRRNQVKLLLWEGDGLALYHKRLERGTYELPATGSSSPEAASAAITSQQLLFILQGVSLQKVHLRPRYQKAG